MKLIITLIVCLVAGCSSNSGQQSSTPTPKEITAAELKNLRWIEGSWKGTGDIDKPFYERYKFENDTTLLIESADDESFSKITDATRYELKDGAFGKFGEGSQWVVTAFDQNSITFAPVAKARNGLIWQRESADVWKATLSWPAHADKPAGKRVYRMDRIK